MQVRLGQEPEPGFMIDSQGFIVRLLARSYHQFIKM